ncbi:MAG: hypothetical protein DRN20_06725, partial [Thermoplasmata archaeon]
MEMRRRVILRKDKRAQSEVIGTIITLGITVTLFASVFWWVYSMKAPPSNLHIDFTADGSDLENNWINITHKGGDILYNWSTLIIVHIRANGVSKYINLFLSNSSKNIGNDWDIGETWCWHCPPAKLAPLAINNLSEAELVEVSIIDNSRGSLIWTITLVEAGGEEPPLIVDKWYERYVDGVWQKASELYANASFRIYAKITDKDRDIDTNGVNIDLSQIGLGVKNMSLVSGSTVLFYYENTEGAKLSWDGKTVKISAKDIKGHETHTYMTLRVVLKPGVYQTYLNSTYYYLNATGNYSESGIPSYISYTSGLQGYDIFKGNETYVDISQPCRNFTQGDWVYVRVASWNIYAANTENTFILMTQAGNALVPPSSYEAFELIGTSPYLYEYKFNTSGYPDGMFTVIIRLKDDLGHAFYATDSIIIGEPQNITGINTYKEYPSDLVPPTNEFETSDRIYVALFVNTLDTPALGDSTISDYYGNTQVRGTPPSLPLMSAVTTDTGLGAYVFYIDLKFANQDPWIPGRQAYTLKVLFEDEDESYTFVKQIYITAPRNRQDFVVGSTGIGVGQQNFAHYDYLFWIKNNNFFTT